MTRESPVRVLSLVVIGLLMAVSLAVAETVRVVAVEANVRLQMDSASTVVATVKAGTVLAVDRRDGNWYRVRLPGEQGLERVGYIAVSDVEADAPASASPAKSTASPPGLVPGKHAIVVDPFTAAPGVELPYDLKQLQAQLIADLKVQIKDFEIMDVTPAPNERTFYKLSGQITAWNPGNAAKRMVIGLGSGRESTDLQFRLNDASGQTVLERKETIRTNFYSQGAGSVGTLAHPIAQKIAERVKDAKLK